MQLNWRPENATAAGLIALQGVGASRLTCADVALLALHKSDGRSTREDVSRTLSLHGFAVEHAGISANKGSVSVTSTALQYSSVVLSAAGVATPAVQQGEAYWASAQQGVTDRVKIVSLTQLALDPPYVVAFCHPGTVQRLVCEGGSGRTSFAGNDSAVAALTPSNNNTFVDVAPLHPGAVSVTATDLGLENSAPAVATVLFTPALSVQLSVREQVRNIRATVPCRVAGGEPFR